MLFLSQTGRIEPNYPKVCGHQGNVLDIKWNPFIENIIASCSEDTSVSRLCQNKENKPSRRSSSRRDPVDMACFVPRTGKAFPSGWGCYCLGHYVWGLALGKKPPITFRAWFSQAWELSAPSVIERAPGSKGVPSSARSP